jgi:hypothetical protein
MDKSKYVKSGYTGKFNINNINFDRGIFTFPIESDSSDEWGNKVAEFKLKPNLRMFVIGNQTEFIDKYLNRSHNLTIQKIIQKLNGPMDFGKSGRNVWHDIDEIIGKMVKKWGYKLIHYNKDSSYGNVVVILDRSAIESYRLGSVWDYDDLSNRKILYPENNMKSKKSLKEISDGRIIYDGKYTFIDFPELGNAAGFRIPSDVRFGSIYIGTIESDTNGYMIKLIDTTTGKKTVRQTPRNRFKSKDLAAIALHRSWKELRNTEL